MPQPGRIDSSLLLSLRNYLLSDVFLDRLGGSSVGLFLGAAGGSNGGASLAWSLSRPRPRTPLLLR